MIRKLIAAAALAAALAPFAAEAKTVAFTFETETFDVTGRATLADTLDAAGGYDVEQILGSVDWRGGGAPISGLVSNPSQPWPADNGTWIYDNVVYPAAPFLDNPGVLFAAGGYDYNAYTIGSTYYLSTNNPLGVYNPGEVITSGYDPAVAPELGTWWLMALGFVALAGAGRRSARKDRLADRVLAFA